MPTLINATDQIEPTSLETAITNTISTDPTTVTGAPLTGYAPVAGTVTPTDSVLEGLEKIDGTLTQVKNGDIIIIDGGDSTN